MVSLANRHQLLTTDQKRFLIGLRMAEIGLDGSYKVHPDKIGKFNRIFGQFLNELTPGERCDKSECLTCDRLQSLLEDFHGKQESAEFQRFMDWFQKSTLLYQTPEPVAPPPDNEDGAETEPTFTRLDPAATDPMAGLGSALPTIAPATTAPPERSPVPPQPIAPVPQPIIAVPQAISDSPIRTPGPLFRLDTGHPLISQLLALVEVDHHSLAAAELRVHTELLHSATRQLLDGLAKV